MKALITYASWFGHNRTIATLLAQALANQGLTVICAPASRVKVESVVGLDLLVLGTYTHVGQANRRLIQLCDTIPRQRLERIALAVYGTQSAELLHINQPGGVDELIEHLDARGFDLMIPPLRIGLRGAATILPGKGIGATERREIQAFARDLLEACVPAPLI